jgi:hypothetical protein
VCEKWPYGFGNGQVGILLPPLEELWNTIDPLGREYDSLAAFERDFQRRRQDFAQMISAANTEISIRERPAST